VTTLRRVLGHRDGRQRLPPDTLGVDLGDGGEVGASIAMWRAVREEVRSFRPDLLVCDGLELPSTRTPVVSVVRDLVGTGWDETVAPRVWRVRARRARAIVVPHDRVRRELTAVGVDPFRVTVIPELVRLPAALPMAPTSDPLIVLHPGAIHPAKGQHLSIDAVSRLTHAEKGHVRLVVAGPAPNPRYLAQLRVAATGQPVTFVADPSSLERLVAEASLAVYPTALDEGCPDAALLCLAHGRAVVAPNRPTLRDQLGPGAVLVEPGDAVALRDALRSALVGSIDVAALGAAGARFVADQHGWPRVWLRWRTLMGGLVSGARPAPAGSARSGG
jgi:glycosyltransferase involved in cell wall biosynthesis